MNKNEVYEMCKKAFEENKVKELLKGEEGFACTPDKSVPANIPTDWSIILENGVYKLNNNISNIDICEKIRSAFFELLKGTPVEVWVAFRVFFTLLYDEKKGYSNLNIINKDMQIALFNALTLNEKSLKECYLWQGINRKEGLWSDIVGANNSMTQLFGVSVL